MISSAVSTSAVPVSEPGLASGEWRPGTEGRPGQGLQPLVMARAGWLSQAGTSVHWRLPEAGVRAADISHYSPAESSLRPGGHRDMMPVSSVITAAAGR